MRFFRSRSLPALVCLTALLAAGCASSGPAGSPAAGKETGDAASRCENGTLGFETVSLSRQLRKELAIPEATQGAVVVEVFPGSPAAGAGLAAGDLIEQIGPSRVTNDCEFV